MCFHFGEIKEVDLVGLICISQQFSCELLCEELNSLFLVTFLILFCSALFISFYFILFDFYFHYMILI